MGEKKNHKADMVVNLRIRSRYYEAVLSVVAIHDIYIVYARSDEVVNLLCPLEEERLVCQSKRPSGKELGSNGDDNAWILEPLYFLFLLMYRMCITPHAFACTRQATTRAHQGGRA